VQTYNDKPDVEFWNKILNVKEGTQGSGSSSIFTGWLPHLFGIYEETE
jgi:hypothetical protein